MNRPDLTVFNLMENYIGLKGLNVHVKLTCVAKYLLFGMDVHYSIHCVCEQQILGRNCEEAQGGLILRWSPKLHDCVL